MSQNASPELNGLCPVAYFELGRPAAGSSKFSTVFDGRLYHFVSEEAKHKFEQSPEKYLPAFGGQCAFGMSIEKEFEADPTNFKIVDGRLFLFLKNDETDALLLWNNEDESKCLANANSHWQSKLAS